MSETAHDQSESTTEQESPLPDRSPWAGHEEGLRKMGYRSRIALERLRRRDKLTYQEIADFFGVSPGTIGNWCRKYGIEGGPNWDGTFSLENYRGYPQMHVDSHRIRIHQLVAIADGADPHKVLGSEDHSVHHKNGIKVDNRPSNLELLTVSEHGSIDAPKRTNQYSTSDLIAVVQYMLNPAEWEGENG